MEKNIQKIQITHMPKEKKCNCCGWDDDRYMHEPGCNLYKEKPNMPKENEIIEEFREKFIDGKRIKTVGELGL